jgi:hypothetical protein
MKHPSYTLIIALSNTQNKQTIHTHAHIQTHTKDELNHQMRSIVISTYELNTVFNIRSPGVKDV